MVPVAKYLNGILHERAKTVCMEYNGIPEKVSNFKLCELIDKTNPILLQFLRELTQSARQSKRKLFEDLSPEVDTKTIRLVFALSVLQFCTNNMHLQCSTTCCSHRIYTMSWWNSRVNSYSKQIRCSSFDPLTQSIA